MMTHRRCIRPLLGILLLLLLSVAGCDSPPSQPAAEWSQATQIAGQAQGLSHISGLVVDEQFAYVTIGGNLADQQAGTSGLRKITLASGEVTTLADGTNLPQADYGGLALDGQYVYWNGGGKLLRIAKHGGPVEIIASDHVGIGLDLAVDEAKVYWANHRYYSADAPSDPSPIYTVAKSGGPVTIFADAQNNPHSLLVDKTFVYWLTPTTIFKQSKASTQPQLLYQTLPTEGIDQLAQDEAYLYFGFRGSGESRWALRKVAKSGGEPQTLVERYSLKPVVVDKTHLYFFSEDSLTNDGLGKVAKSGGAITILDTGYASGVIAQSKTELYFATLDDLYRLTK